MAAQVAGGAKDRPIARADLRRLGDPLALIVRDHMRARCMHAAMTRIAEAQPRPEDDPAAVASFLRHELPPHLDDEERELFPLLRRRCLPEEDIAATLDRLEAEHDRERAETAQVIALLSRLVAGVARLDPDAAAEVHAYARASQRHLIVENAIVLPLARARLTRRDKDRLLTSMVRRRGLDALLPPAGSHPAGEAP